MHILFVADPLASFKIYKDTTFAMMREAQKRGHQVWACEPQDVVWRSGQQVTARMHHVQLTGRRRLVRGAVHRYQSLVQRGRGGDAQRPTV